MMEKSMVVTNEKRNKVQGEEPFFERTAVVWKTALGSAVAWEIARLTGSNHPYLAPLTLILCLQATIGQSVRYALYRSVGTVVGVLMIGSFAKSMPVTAWALGFALLGSTSLLKIFRVNDQLIHQVALSILFVLYFENHSTGYAWDRAKDTLIGAVVGVTFVMLLFPPNEARKTEQAIGKFVHRFVDTVNQVAQALQQNLLHSAKDPSERLNALLDELQQIAASLKKVEQGVSLHVYANQAKQAKAEQLEQRFHAIRDACVHFVTLTKTFTETMTAEQRNEWSRRIQGLASEMTKLIYDNSWIRPPSVAVNPSPTFKSDVSDYELRKVMDSLRRF